MARTVHIALYGTNGHQLHPSQVAPLGGEIVAVAGMPDVLPEAYRDIPAYPSLEALLADPAVEVVSLCSPLRAEQDADAVRCLEAGKHVYGEKPSALSEAGLDRIIAAARRTGKRYHEQAGTAFTQPYATLREVVASGVLGEIIQIYAQKSYPWSDWRPRDERIDGGLITQVGVYCTRFVEHVAGMSIRTLAARETLLGNDVPGSDCRRAVSFLMTLENGGVASAIANYCGPRQPDWPNWGYETLRIFGANGFVESIDYGRIGTLARIGHPAAPLDFTAPHPDFFAQMLEEIRTGEPRIPVTLEQELSPTRWVVRAREAYRREGQS